MKTKAKSKLSPVTDSFANEQKTTTSKRSTVIFLALVLFLGLGLVFVKKYKNLIIVGKVNGRPVTRWQLEKSLNDRYAKMVFDDLVGSILLNQLADKNQVMASDEEVKKEIDATEVRIGGKEALQATLERMGYTNQRFTDEMKVQVIVKKLAEKLFKVEITDEEVSKFFQDNKALFPKKTLEESKDDIKQNLTQQKLQEQFGTWFQSEREKASVQSYL